MQTDYGMSASVTQKVVLWVSEDGWCRGEGLQESSQNPAEFVVQQLPAELCI